MTSSRIFVALALGVAAVAAFVLTWTDPPAAPWPDRSIAVDCAKPAPETPEGGIPVNELCNSIIDVPSWQADTTCPSSAVVFNGAATNTYGVVNLTLDRVAYVDIEKDGNAETAVLISCGGQGWRRQVAVMDKTPDGQIRILKQLAVTTYPIAEIFDLSGTQTGELKIQVGDYPSSPGTSNTASSRQWFTYRSNGSQLIRTDSLTLAGNPRVSDLFITASDVTFHRPADGIRTGALTVTVRNQGSSTVPFSLRLTLPAYAEIVNMPPICAAAAPPPEGNRVVCELAGVATNGSTQVELSLRAPQNPNDVAGQTPPVLAAVIAVKDGYADLGISPNSASYSIRLE